MDTNEGIGKYLIPGAVLLVTIAIVAGFALFRDALPSGSVPTQNVDIVNVETEGALAVGAADAPVTMAVWFDYQCPHCQRFEMEIMPQVYANYVDTGKVRVIYKDYQFLGADSDAAALLARAIYEKHPTLYRSWLDAVLAGHASDASFGNLASLTALTHTIEGIDTDAVLARMDEKRSEYQTAIAADRAEGSSFGISGTPAAIIGTTLLKGAYPYDQIAALLDAELTN